MTRVRMIVGLIVVLLAGFAAAPYGAANAETAVATPPSTSTSPSTQPPMPITKTESPAPLPKPAPPLTKTDEPQPEAAPRVPVTVAPPSGQSPFGAAVPPLGEQVAVPQQSPIVGSLPGPAGDAMVSLVADGAVIRVPVNQSRMIELPVDARDVLVGNGGIADVVVKRPRQIFVMGKGVGQTNVFFLDRGGKVVLRAEIHVHIDTDTVVAVLRKLMPNEKAMAESTGDTIFLTGSVRSDGAAAQAAQIARRFVKDDASLVNLLKVTGEQQVLLRVRVAEVQKTALKDLGLYMDKFANKSFAGIASPSTLGAVTSLATEVFHGWVSAPGMPLKMAAQYAALEKQGLIKTLAEPNLTAISGETAKMLAGGEFPVITGSATSGLTITFKPFGVALGFQPIVLSDGKINLKLSSEVSSIDHTISVDTGYGQIFGLKVRRAETSIELASGGSLMVAGMLQNDVLENISGFPFLKDIPILGALFRSESFARNETELVIVVTAFVIAPVDSTALAFPTDGFAPANDLDMYLLGRLSHVFSETGGPPPADAIRGPLGYILE